MKKNKTYTVFWLGVIFICVCLMIVLLPYAKGPVSTFRHDLPVFSKPITLSHNKYGHYLVGFMARQNKDYSKMEAAYEKALIDDPNDEKLKRTVYLLKAIKGDIVHALPMAKELNGLKQAELLTDYVILADSIKNGQYDAAEKILSQKPPYGADQILKPALTTWIKVGQGKKEEAQKALETLNSSRSKSLYFYYRALLGLSFQDEKAAEDSFNKMTTHLVNGYPSLTAVVFLRDFYQKQGRWKAGLPEYDQLQTFIQSTPSVKDVINDLKSPTTVTPQIGVGIAFYDISVALAPFKLEETSLLFNALALYLIPDAVSPKIWGGELLETTGNFQTANKIYSQIPHQSDIIVLKTAMNLIAEEDYAPAIPLLNKLIQNNPDDGYLYMVLGDVYFQLKNYPEAISSYQSAIKLLKKGNIPSVTGKALFMLGTAFDSSGQSEEAEKTLLEALHFAPNDAITLNYLGYLWLDKNKNIDEAFNMVSKAFELSPNDPNIIDSMAWGYYLKKDYKKALELAEQSTDRLPYSSVAYAHLGDIYAALNRKREASHQYRKALDLTADLTPKLKAELEQKLNLTR